MVRKVLLKNIPEKFEGPAGLDRSGAEQALINISKMLRSGVIGDLKRSLNIRRQSAAKFIFEEFMKKRPHYFSYLVVTGIQQADVTDRYA